jgi:hypothetical protein
METGSRNRFICKGNFVGDPGLWAWQVQESSLIRERLRESWPLLRSQRFEAANRFARMRKNRTSKLDDDIPF